MIYNVRTKKEPWVQSPAHQTRRHMITAISPLRDEVDPRSLQTRNGPNTHLTVCLAMLLTAQIGIPLLLSTMAFIKIRRVPAFYNFIFIIWIGTPVYALLFYAGQSETDTVRPKLCAAQAILKHGVDPAAVSALCLLSVESWRLANGETVDSRWSAPRLILTLAIPYAHFVAYLIVTTVLVIADPHNAYRGADSFYCTVANTTFGLIQSVELNALVLVTLIFEVKTGLLYWKRRKTVEKYKPNPETNLNRSTFIRLTVFTLWQFIGLLGNSVSFGSNWYHIAGMRYAMYIIAASIPLVVFLVFSTQKDIMLKWCFWKAVESPHSRGTEPDRAGNPPSNIPNHDNLVVYISSAAAYKNVEENLD
ncbi:hypothetical protein SISSUDRAFT_1051367 [Sistotremastrum suecicum HHB10207 ss-3]|uniref:Uncharacterized protein n=1 Tax=Sistotremastrum suecicum HHB10207 ss-3 TaxID=1314776 RepID=A0A166AMN3_9AGAM|nr:hypothetical protein SISSUDRAFT_1051367 [Sistotremastrum suecicum HHB10207 ss-3]